LFLLVRELFLHSPMNVLLELQTFSIALLWFALADDEVTIHFLTDHDVKEIVWAVLEHVADVAFALATRRNVEQELALRHLVRGIVWAPHLEISPTLTKGFNRFSPR
jgi:hypothetical protein